MTAPPGLRAVFFDAVGTLIEPDPPAADVYAAVGRRFGADLPRDTIAARFREAFRREEEADRGPAGWATSEPREWARWMCIVAHVFDRDLPGAAQAMCFAELWDHFARPTAWRVAPDAGEVLAALAGRGYTLGVGSNFDARLHAVLDGLPDLAPLRHRVVSSEVGWRKPAPGFFAAVVRAAGCEPGEIVFVGDGAENDYAGANAAGLVGVLLDPRPTGPAGRGVRRLADLPAVLTSRR